MIKRALLMSFVVLSNSCLYAEHNETLSKIEQVQLVENENQKLKALEKLMNYDVTASIVEIDEDIKLVKLLREDVLDKLGLNKECHIVATQIEQLKKKIQEYERFKGKEKADEEIEKSKKIIEKVKKECPRYLNLKGEE